ncbi:unnamed protein product [Psylliodes chrysocephalus]|uniref:Guanine deaminase n=1 Tax=Psylliodes chrysocephalus TaxID=3402493 RepID=A0A9P0GC71_9CUCU|nr:unnamed protein product [Psylliodes chrysocephala]
MAALNAQIFIGNIIHSKSRDELEVLENGYIIVVGSKILAIGLEPTLNDAKARLSLGNKAPVTTLSKSQLLIPGFVDTHLHAPQYPNCGLGYDKHLMDWLNTYTYPLESKYSDLELSRRVFKALVKKTLDYGTTTACYFGTLFNESCNILVDTVVDQGQRALIGKVNMTKGAPDNYLEIPVKSLENTREFVKYVQSKKSNLVKPIITPRFALSVDLDMMKELSLLAKCENLHLQTHISENKEEVELVQEQYGMHYANVYDEANLLTQKTILAHGIYLVEDELKLIARRGTSIAHCPDSNLCLKSGACNVRQLWDYGISVGLGTDISGGTLPSVVTIMRLCLYSSIHFSFHIKNYQPLNYEEVFYLGTLGGAEALSLQKEIGNFEVNKDFDALIIDLDTETGLDYLLPCTPRELLQKFIYCGDDRNIINVYVAGRLVK